MPPRIIQDSDEEEPSDASPVKPNPEIQFQADEHQHGAFTTAAEPLTGEESEVALESMAPISPPNLPGRVTDLPTFHSSSASRITRRQTTMEQVGSKRKAQKQYGSKTTLDDLGLHCSVSNGDWARDEDEVDLIPERNRRKRSSQQSIVGTQNSLIKDAPIDTFGLDATQFSGSQVALGTQQGSVSVSLSQAVDTALNDLQMVSELDPPLTRGANVTEGIGTRTHGAYQARLRDESILVDARSEISMETPTFDASGGLPPESAEVEPAEPLDTVSQADTTRVAAVSDRPRRGENKFASNDDSGTQERNPISRSKCKKSFTHSTQESNNEDELASGSYDNSVPKEVYVPRKSRSRRSELPENFMDSIDFSARPERPSKRKNKLKRNKTTNDIPMPVSDEDDELATGGRKKRSRKGDTTPQQPDPLDEDTIKHKSRFTNIEKRKNKPREDDSDEIKVEVPEHVKDMTEENCIEEVGASKPSKKKEGRLRRDASKILDHVDRTTKEIAASNDIDFEAKEVLVQPPKTRGRKKKNVPDQHVKSKEFIDEVDSENDEQLLRNPVEEEDSDTELAPQRGRKRSKLQVHTDAEERAKSISPAKPVVERPALREKTVSTNPLMMPDPQIDVPQDKGGSTDEGLKETSKKCVAEEFNTPKKLSDAKVVKHSPLSSGRAIYRVGLSKRARIEPLLKITRK